VETRATELQNSSEWHRSPQKYLKKVGARAAGPFFNSRRHRLPKNNRKSGSKSRGAVFQQQAAQASLKIFKNVEARAAGPLFSSRRHRLPKKYSTKKKDKTIPADIPCKVFL